MGLENIPGVGSVLGMFSNSPSASMGPRKVTIIGSGNWSVEVAFKLS
ncbi:hypothetical protein GCK32_021842, partial [Trichostrongylus colubriformis]